MNNQHSLLMEHNNKLGHHFWEKNTIRAKQNISTMKEGLLIILALVAVVTSWALGWRVLFIIASQ